MIKSLNASSSELRPTDRLTDSLTRVKCRDASASKNEENDADLDPVALKICVRKEILKLDCIYICLHSPVSLQIAGKCGDFP